jgi:NitT/TauT family transport system permease protein
MAQIYLPERTEEARRTPRAPIAQQAEAPNQAKETRTLGLADAAVIAALVGAVALLIAAAGRWTAQQTPSVSISLRPAVLPLYAGYSVLRMTLAYILSIVFTLVYGHIAATNRFAERFMVPVLDILQSIPILSFLPVAVLALIALFPHSNIGVELAAVLLIFTSQAWNMTFSFYHAAKTLPLDLREAAAVFRLSPLRRFSQLEVPYSMIGLVWNSMMSWAGGWFFLMAAEQLTLGSRSFQLPGLGSYLQVAANHGNVGALLLGLLTLIILIVLLDFVLWRPLVAWSDKFKFEQTRTTDAPESPILDLLRRSALLEIVHDRIAIPVGDRLSAIIDRLMPAPSAPIIDEESKPHPVTAGTVIGWAIAALIAVAAIFGIASALRTLAHVSLANWGTIVLDGLFTLLRTALAIAIGAAWTVPLGVTIGMNPVWSRRLQPIVQVVASIPATALFPIVLLFVIELPAGINIAAILLMLLGTQWYILFNVIAGAMAIPSDLREAASIFRLQGWNRWKTLILPAIFPYLVTGLITASGGAWNASVVAEYVTFNAKTFSTPGIGSAIAQAAATQNLPVLLASTLAMAAIVVTINRLVWRRLYRLAERRFNLG